MLGLGPQEWAALLLSVQVSLVATIVALPLALWVAWILARRAFRGKIWLSALVHLPLVLPPVVTGYLLLVVFGRRGVAGAFLEDVFGLVLAFRWTGAALAAGIMGFPLMVRAIRLAIEAVDPRLEAAAATLGAGRLAVFWLVTWPLILPGVLAAATMGFAKAMGEFGATITFVANIPGEIADIALAIYAFLQVPGGELAALRMVGLSLVVAMGAVVLSEVLARRVARRIAGI